MKQLVFSAIIALAAPVYAQAPEKAPAKPEAMKPQAEAPKPEESKPEAQAETQKQAAAPRRGPRRWHEDARHCLDRPTNTEIIKCAEEYL